MTRRQLLAGAAGTAFAAGYRPKIAAQVYVWVQHFARRGTPLEKNLPEMFSGIAAAGYDTVELMNQLFEPAVEAETRALLKKHKLRMPILYHGGVMHEPAAAETTERQILAVAAKVRDLGVEAINTNPNPKPQRARKTDAELDTQLKTINRIGSALARLGMKLTIHQHAPEMAEDAREWRHILRGSDPAQVQVCLDLHWVYRGGLDPMTLLKESGPRLHSLHLRNSRNKIWTEDFGDGDIDYREVARYLRQIAFQGYLVVELAYDKETEITRPVPESLRRSREYAERVFLKA